MPYFLRIFGVYAVRVLFKMPHKTDMPSHQLHESCVLQGVGGTVSRRVDERSSQRVGCVP